MKSQHPTPSIFPWIGSTLALFALGACAGDTAAPYVMSPDVMSPELNDVPDVHTEDAIVNLEDNAQLEEQAMALPGRRLVDELNRVTCTTRNIKPLSEQLVAEIGCMRPGLLSRIDNIPGVNLSAAVLPLMQRSAAESLARAQRSRGGSIFITSATRTLPQQFLLRSWFERGRCGFQAAALPGNSNHETALAIDTTQYASWRTALSRAGFRWLGPGDKVHYDYVAGGIVLRSISIQAFQRLWNRNNPDDTISVDGAYGPATRSRLLQAPMDGFARGAFCETPPAVPGLPVYYTQQGDRTYTFSTIAPPEVVRVTYTADEIEIASASRATGDTFDATYSFNNLGADRPIQVVGYDAADEVIARGTAFIDVGNGTGVFLRQVDGMRYDVGLERAPADVAFVSLEVDGSPVVDALSGDDLTPRLAVRTPVTPGRHSFAVTTHNADGSRRGTITRSYVVEESKPFNPAQDGEVLLEGMAVDWAVQADGSYAFETVASSTVAAVSLSVDGFPIAYALSDGTGTFSTSYAFSSESTERDLVVMGLDAAGRPVARALAKMDVVPGFGVYVQQKGGNDFEVGLERAPDGVAFVGLAVNGDVVVDTETGLERSPRLGVRTALETGSVQLRLDTYNPDGTYRGSLRRTFTVPASAPLAQDLL